MGRSATAHSTPAAVPGSSVPQSAHASSGTGDSVALAGLCAFATDVPAPTMSTAAALRAAPRELLDQDNLGLLLSPDPPSPPRVRRSQLRAFGSGNATGRWSIGFSATCSGRAA